MNDSLTKDNRIAFTNVWSKWWREFLGAARDRDRVAIEILRQRYIEEMQGIAQLTKHAHTMQYAQFCEKLLQFTADKRKYAVRIAEKIIALGGKLPEVPERHSSGENSWRCLQIDLAEEKRCADHLPEQMWQVASDHPEIATFLQQIFEAEYEHRQEIERMLMRSDGFALSLA